MSKPEQVFKRTRIAPTPSGFLHLGNVLSFVHTAALAAKTNAKILLRIDDLDQERIRTEYVQDVFDTLNFLQIPWHEGPRNVAQFESSWSQKHRMPLYQKALEQLKETGHVYACNCSRAAIRANSPGGIYPGTCRHKNIPLDTPGTSWHLRTDLQKQLQVKTIPGNVVQTTLPAAMSDFVVKRKDGLPAYQLASVIDDQYFGVDLIVRGEDLWESTLAQCTLSPLIGAAAFSQVTFHHHPLLMEADGKKLSKSAGATSVRYLRENGCSAADVYSKIAEMAGIAGRVGRWEDLAEALFQSYQ